MTYTKSQRRQMAAALRKARIRIENHGSLYVCLALDGVADIDRYSRLLARQYVREQLEGFDSLEGWLAWHWTGAPSGSIKLQKAFITALSNRAKMRETRLAWIDHMIATLEP